MGLRGKDLSVGDSRESTVVDDLTRTQLVMYSGASGDYNPLHSDEVFATQVAGFPGVFAHGMLTMAMTGKALTDWVGDGRLKTFGVRFRGQVWPGDTLVVTTVVEELRAVDGGSLVDLKVTTRNQKGDVVLAGTATARLDD
ncbi:MaoC/PaaZ C-terminal domain-containing protein [Streptosporangium sp. NPDC002544]|uniref:MaoC/PaaZ C-terminal domain-containing protein n=1 Tax=Streptosporangium sp. NPDC002544 TaxID=3154538 RepID=UPI00333260DB